MWATRCGKQGRNGLAPPPPPASWLSSVLKGLRHTGSPWRRRTRRRFRTSVRQWSSGLLSSRSSGWQSSRRRRAHCKSRGGGKRSNRPGVRRQWESVAMESDEPHSQSREHTFETSPLSIPPTPKTRLGVLIGAVAAVPLTAGPSRGDAGPEPGPCRCGQWRSLLSISRNVGGGGKSLIEGVRGIERTP